MTASPYLSYSRYLRERHGCTVYRVSVDAGFNCPNRAGGRESPGCTYCTGDGARAPYLPAPAVARGLEDQIGPAIAFLRRRYGAQAFILYFQAYSNTNAPVDELARIYDSGLALAPFVGMNVATRPDCIDGEKARLLASYRERGLDVWVEMGLQSSNDATLARIGRGHTSRDFLDAYRLLKEHGIPVAVHLIFGLPGETAADMGESVRFVAALDPDGVKIHNLHIPAGTVLADELLRGEVTTPCPERHLEYTIAALERLPARTVIMRLVCDTPPARLASPRHFWPKQTFARRLEAEMNARGTWQGRLSPSLASPPSAFPG